MLIEVKNLLLHVVGHLNLGSSHLWLLVVLHWWCLLLETLLLHWLRLTEVLLIWLSHIADITGFSGSKVMVGASLAGPTIALSILLGNDSLFLLDFIILLRSPLVSKFDSVVITASIARGVNFLSFFLN